MALLLFCALGAALLLGPAAGYDIDLILPHNTPRDCECAPWASQAFSALMFADPETREASKSHCAQPANQPSPDRSQPPYDVQSGWCYCADATEEQWYTFCDPPRNIPSQINLLAVNDSAIQRFAEAHVLRTMPHTPQQYAKVGALLFLLSFMCICVACQLRRVGRRRDAADANGEMSEWISANL